MDSKTYFAAADSLELAANLDAKITIWSDIANKNGLKNTWQRAYNAYYGRHWFGYGSAGQGSIINMGDQGELSAVTANDFRNLIKHMLVLTTNQKPAFDPRATNTDEKSQTQTRLAKNILDYYVREKRLRRFLTCAAELALVMGKGFVKCTWDKQSGKPYSVSTYQGPDGEEKQRMVYEGDVKLVTLDALSVFVDQSLEDWDQVQWVDTLEWVNKFDLAAEHPEMADQILELPTKNDMQGMRGYLNQGLEDTNLIAVKEFYHLRSPALINGRFQRRLNSEIVLYDGPMPYKKLPVFRIVPGRWYGSTEGYTEAFDILNLQQSENVVWSTIYTNLQTYGVQNVLMPDGCNITPIQLAKSLQVLKYNPAAGKPEGLNLTQIPPEAFKYLEMVNQKMETVFGMNSVSRGTPDGELSGKAMGLLQSMAIQYASGFQESYAELAEDVGTFILHLINDFAQTERIISIAGKFNKGDVVKFQGGDLDQIERVVVELGNPMSKTLAGRLDIARDLLQNGLIANPQEYINVLETGNLETMTEAPESELALIRAENEALTEGKPVVVLRIDKHIQHAREHKTLLSRPDVRINGQLTAAVLQHIAEHEQYFFQEGANPFYLAITGEPGLPPPPPGAPGLPPGPMPPPGPQQGNGAPPPDTGPIEEPPQPEQALQQALN